MRLPLLICCTAGLLVSRSLEAQQGRFQLGANVGVLDDGTRLIGAHVGVAFATAWVGYFGASRVGEFGPHETLTVWEAGIRWLPPTSGRLRPYLLAAFGNEQARAPTVRHDQNGWFLGGGLETGKGKIQPFAEARLFTLGGGGASSGPACASR